MEADSGIYLSQDFSTTVIQCSLGHSCILLYSKLLLCQAFFFFLGNILHVNFPIDESRFSNIIIINILKYIQLAYKSSTHFLLLHFLLSS